MIGYIAKRVLLILLIVLVIIFIIFLLLYRLPVSMVRTMPAFGDGDFLDSIFNFFNASDTFFTKYLRYCYDLLIHRNMSRSAGLRAQLSREFSYRITNTLKTLLFSVGVTLLVGIPLGAHAAVHKDSKKDRAINAVTLLLSAIPNYAVAMVLVLVLSVRLGILPVINTYTSLTAYIIPTLVIALGGISLITRITRTSMLEILEQPYITALRAKGLRENNIIMRHAFKNALVPVVSILGSFVTQMLCGTFVVEQFFNVPGLGSMLLRTITSREHTELLGCTVVLTVFLAATNIVVDVAYTLLNPQIRLRYSRGSRRKILTTPDVDIGTGIGEPE